MSRGMSGGSLERTEENVIWLVTSCSVRKVYHRYISQYLKFQEILKFNGCQLVASFMVFSETPT